MKIGFIGCGNMGGALALAVSKIQDTKIYLCDTDSSKAAALQLATGGEIADAFEIAEHCRYIFIGVKPAGIGALLGALSDTLAKNSDATLISMAAGVKIEKLESFLSQKMPIIRILPNTPVTVGCGMTVFSVNNLVTDDRKQDFLGFMKESGTVTEISEDEIDAACAVMGCGPAFAYMFADALAKAGEECGLSSADAIQFAAQMMKGSAEMVLKVSKTPDTLKNEVCSPGGSTIEGVHSLEASGFAKICRDAVIASFEKTKKLGMS